MTDTRKILSSGLVSAALFAFGSIGIARAQTADSVTNAELRHLRVDGDPAREIARLSASSDEPIWIAWTVPAVDAEHVACCTDAHDHDRRTACRLESRSGSWSHSTVMDRGGDVDLRVLVRIDDGKVNRVRAYTADCLVDAGGRTFYEAEGVGAADSVRYLSSLLPLDRNPSREPAEGALMAIALHEGDEANGALERFTDPASHEELRERGAFWLGITRGREGFERLRWMMRNDPSTDVKEQVIFALSQSPVDQAMDLLFATARKNENAELRGQALFWLGQQAGERAVDALQEAVHEDPDSDVREQAVFALSQLPADEGVPLLIDLARTSRHPEVRRSAMFWLGQSKDDRALDLFEEILAR